MGVTLFHYVGNELPDPSDWRYRTLSGGNVSQAVRAACELILRSVAAQHPGSVSAGFWLLYTPKTEARDARKRLTISLVARAETEEAASAIKALLDRSALRHFHGLREGKAPPMDWQQAGAACDIVRRVDLLDATVGTESNARALPAYLVVELFVPRSDSDFWQLLNTLGGIREPVLVEVLVSPVGVSQEISASTRLISRLQDCSRAWDMDSDCAAELEWLDDRGAARSTYPAEIKPLRRKDPIAEHALRTLQRVHEEWTKAHLRFVIRVHAKTPEIARLVASTFGQAAFEEGSYQLVDSLPDDLSLRAAAGSREAVRVVPVPALERCLAARGLGMYEELAGLPNLATVDEFLGAFQLPIASHGSPCCIRRNTDPPGSNPDNLLVLGHEAVTDPDVIAKIRQGIPVGISLDAFCRHLMVVGAIGSGKSVGMLSKLDLLAENDVSFLVFEPAKAEYRVLKSCKGHRRPGLRRLAKELRIYTPGNEDISPFRHNPLFIPPGISRDEHIGSIQSVFAAAMPLAGPLPALLGEGLERIHEEHPDPDDPPRMTDLCAAVHRVITAKRYSKDVESDLRGAVDVRLGSLTRRAMGRVFQCGRDVPSIEQLMTGFTVTELRHLPQDQGCLLVLFLFSAIRERIRAGGTRK